MLAQAYYHGIGVELRLQSIYRRRRLEVGFRADHPCGHLLELARILPANTLHRGIADCAAT